MKLTIVAGARPNFMKIAPLIHEIKKRQKQQKLNLHFRLVHTGQHYDPKLSETFFKELQIPAPDVNLEVGSGTQAEQTANIMVKFEKELTHHPTDLVIVVGDVTSTMACALVAKKLCIRVAHIEAGIRSFDLKMPEEINRMVTDAISDYFFTTTTFANNNLMKSGISNDKIFYVGNIMIDTLLKNIESFRKPDLFGENNLKEGQYIVITLHRPSNVDDADKLKKIIMAVIENTEGLPLVFPVHPRTRNTINKLEIQHERLILCTPLSYLEFNFLVKNSKAVITDSGGIQEETTVMNIPCITMRNNTERPETVEIGSNVLTGDNIEALKNELQNILTGNWKKSGIPALWDGNTAQRIVDHLLSI